VGGNLLHKYPLHYELQRSTRTQLVSGTTAPRLVNLPSDTDTDTERKGNVRRNRNSAAFH